MTPIQHLNDILKRFENGQFILFKDQKLANVCNAPKDASGVYLVFKDNLDFKSLVYIGASGKMLQSGEFKHRIYGLNARIRNGNHQLTNVPRRKAWPNFLSNHEMQSINVKWYITVKDKEVLAIPTKG
jgi:hypothetical protein